MIGILIAIASAGAWLGSARLLYGHWRPMSEPVYCHHYSRCRDGDHDEDCYKKATMSLSDTEARVFALMAGLLWPVVLLLFGAGWVAFRKPRIRPQEAQAKIARLERELGMRSR